MYYILIIINRLEFCDVLPSTIRSSTLIHEIDITKSIAPEYIGSGSSIGSLKLINMSTALDNPSCASCHNNSIVFPILRPMD